MKVRSHADGVMINYEGQSIFVDDEDIEDLKDELAEVIPGE